MRTERKILNKINSYSFYVFLFCDKFIISGYFYICCEMKQGISIDF